MKMVLLSLNLVASIIVIKILSAYLKIKKFYKDLFLIFYKKDIVLFHPISILEMMPGVK